MNYKFATFGGGCFWGVEKFLQQIPGVIDAVSGYAGGDFANPTYAEVCRGNTGHAEVVNVEYNPEKISFSELLKKFIKTYRDVNPQNLKSESQYRSIVFYRNSDEKEDINEVFKEFARENGKTITTQVKSFDQFYKAEDFHQDYYGVCRVEE